MTDRELLEIAEKMKDKSYAPYSGYRVGAALLCGDGSVETGCNVENISYSGTICAERTAFVKAVSEGKKEFLKLAISVSGDEVGIPCGICLQFLSEFVSGDFEVICGNKSGEYKKYPFSKLLPIVFRAKF
ncbi:MAG: cytidine deaminase [Monoglobales bacterium]